MSHLIKIYADCKLSVSSLVLKVLTCRAVADEALEV